MTMNGGQLVVLAVLLWLLSWGLRLVPLDLDSTLRKILFGLGRVAKVASLAAAIAALIVLLVPALGPVDLTQENVGRLNERIEQYHKWLEWSWVVLLALTSSLLAAIWFGRTEITTVRALLAGRFVKATSWAKVLVGILSCFTFTGAGLEGRVSDRLSDAQSAEVHVREIQAEVFTKTKQTVAQDLVSSVLDQAENQSPRIQSLARAYSLAGPYLPDQPRYTSAPLQSDGQQPPDISPADAEKLKKDLADEDRARTSQDALTKDMVEVAFDKGASDSVKQFLLHIQNPLLSEIAGAVLDPLFAEPAEKFIRAKAAQVMEHHLDRERRLADVKAAAQHLAAGLVAHAPGKGRASYGDGEMGEPRWERLRNALRVVVRLGLEGKGVKVQNDARAMVARFDEVWEAAKVVIPDPQVRAQQGEKIFYAYLNANHDLAALWGYVVISATPHDLDRELTDIALEQGPGQERLKLLRELVLRSATEPESRQLLNQFDPNHTLKADSPDAAFSRLWYARHGAYPVDGYILYSHEVNGAASDQAAAAYYNNPNVAKFTTIYCPHTPDQD